MNEDLNCLNTNVYTNYPRTYSHDISMAFYYWITNFNFRWKKFI